MITVTKFVTYDGVIHDTQRDAIKHLDKRYADILLHFARELPGMKFTAAAEYLDANLDEFAELLKIKEDRLLEDDENE